MTFEMGSHIIYTDYKKRDEFVEKNCDTLYYSYKGGIRRFYGLKKEALAKLVEDKLADSRDTQNNSPSIGWFLENMPDTAKFNGYLVAPDRADYRVGIEAVILSDREIEKLTPFVKKAIDTADTIDCCGYNTANGRLITFWWD